MSSEGSVSSNGSGIRQFGLYRTIDSRTEEFLRSSRKRQIRQGCACAAISTAITVTVVVSVILVYEYSINSGVNVNKKTSLKPNWNTLMNDSDITSISSKFNKKINFDRTTLKLLPILLKALNKNRYLEKILEDYSSSPPYAGTDSTEAPFTRNVFSDSKNWLKLPTTRHYSTVYKTSPLIQWKTPTQRLEYLTKIRKIRDYQRMLNYFDKMINDKVGIYQKREFEYFTESSLTTRTIRMTKIDRYRNIQRLRNVSPTAKNANNGVVCYCPNKLGLLLSKLIGALQDMIPHIIGNKLGLYGPCENKKKLIEDLKQLTTAQTVRPTKQRIYDIFSTIAYRTRKAKKKKKPKVTLQKKCCSTSTTSTGTTSKTTSTATKTTTSTAARTTASITTAQNELKTTSIKKPLNLPTSLNYRIYEETTTDYDLLTKPNDTPNTQTTNSVEIKRRTTEKIVPVTFITSTEKWLKPYKADSFYTKVNIPVYKEEDYEYINNTPYKAINEFENLDVHSIESLKTKTTSSGEDMELWKGDKKINFKGTTDDVKSLNYDTVAMQDDVDLTSMRRLADMVYLPQDKTTKVWYTTEPEVSTTSYKKINYPRTQATFINTNSVENFVDPTTSIIGTYSVENFVDPTTSIIGENSVDPTISIIGTNSVENFVDPTTSIIGTYSVENFVDPTTSIIGENSVDPTTSIIGTNSVENFVDPTTSIIGTNSVVNFVDPITSIIGENSVDPTTSILGENFFDPTTSIIGKNSVDPTTSFIGENSFDPTTSIIGEDSVEPTTSITGENSVDPTTSIIGKNSVDPTTSIIGKNSVDPTTSITGKNSVENSIDPTTSIIGENSIDPTTSIICKNSVDPSISIIGSNSIENFFDPTTSILCENSVDPTTSITRENSVDPTTSITGTNSVENSVNPSPVSKLPCSRKNFQIVDSTPDLKYYHYVAASKYRPNSLTMNEQQIIENVGDDEFQEEYLRPTEGSRVPYKYKNYAQETYASIETAEQTAPWEFLANEGKIVNMSSKSMLPASRPVFLEIQRNTEWNPEEHGDYDIYYFNNNDFDSPNID